MSQSESFRHQSSWSSLGESTAPDEYQLVGFTLNNQEYGVNINHIREIIRKVQMTSLPNSPDFVEGVVNLRGSVMPVVDLRTRFGLEKKDEHEENRIIVVELDREALGFIVDSVTEVRRVPRSVIEDPPATATTPGAGYVSGIAKLEHALLIVLDLQKLLSADQIEAVTRLDLVTETESV